MVKKNTVIYYIVIKYKFNHLVNKICIYFYTTKSSTMIDVSSIE